LAISPFWTSWIDTLYCGDPRLAEVPTPGLRSSIACYQDTQVKLFRDASIPWRCIDDSGVLVGESMSIINLGKEDWKDAFILGAIGRGNLLSMIYGKLQSLDNNSDKRFLRTVFKLIEENVKNCANPEFIGGDPARGEIYGYILNSQQSDHFLILHNPSFISRNFDLKRFYPQNSLNIKRLYPEKIEEKSLMVNLRPVEVALWQIGSKSSLFEFDADLKFKDGRELDIITPIYKRKGNKRLIGGIIPKIQLNDQQELESYNLYLSATFTQSIYPWRELLNPKKELKLILKTANNRKLSYKVIPDVDVWACVSWVVYTLPLTSDLMDQNIQFSLLTPWKRLLQVKMNAYLLEKGNRI
jgi:hypothetical protein